MGKPVNKRGQLMFKKLILISLFFVPQFTHAHESEVSSNSTAKTVQGKNFCYADTLLHSDGRVVKNEFGKPVVFNSPSDCIRSVT